MRLPWAFPRVAKLKNTAEREGTEMFVIIRILLRIASVVICCIGATLTLASEERFRILCGESSKPAQLWPFHLLLLASPYLVAILVILSCWKNMMKSILIMLCCLLLLVISFADCTSDVDILELAGLRLLSCLLYHIIVVVVAFGVRVHGADNSGPHQSANDS